MPLSKTSKDPADIAASNELMELDEIENLLY